ncbi:MAG TPA: RdgB/HAM1 family non-canonical purine NTP pyrophosphatase [Pyrinomonadaceae bacterium]
MLNKSTTLLLATGNTGKVRELKELLGELPIELKSLRDYPEIRDVKESGMTFQENAEIKARGFALQTGELSLADDSGLEIEALNGAPGVHSARFAGETAGYDIKIPKLLELLASTGDTRRRSRFVCVMAVADGNGGILRTVRGECNGTIAISPRGSGGFGYDPIFIPDGFDQTFAELDQKVKQEISHRAIAAKLIMRYLLDFIAV